MLGTGRLPPTTSPPPPQGHLPLPTEGPLPTSTAALHGAPPPAAQLRHNEERINAELARAVRWRGGLGAMDDPHTKASLLLQVGAA